MHKFCNFNAGFNRGNMIRNIQYYISILILFQLGFFFRVATAENYRTPEDPEKTAISFFEEGKFGEALPLLEDLIRMYPEDKKLNYYLGASLIETKDFSSKARQALLTSVNKESPEKINYYLGIAFHAVNEFLTALDYYARFEKEAKSKTKKSLDYLNLIDLCEQGVNPFVDEKVSSEEEIVSELQLEPDTVTELSQVNIPVEDIDIVSTEPVVIPQGLSDSIITFQVNPEISYMKVNQFKNKEALKTYIGTWRKKKELDSLVILTDNLRSEYTNIGSEEKQSLGNRILENEQKIIGLNREIPELDLYAHNLEVDYWNKAESGEKEKLLSENKMIADSLQRILIDKQNKINTTPPESVVIPVISKPEPEAEENSMKGIVYKIQIGAFSKEPPDWIKRLYKKLSLIRKISNYKDENGVTVYTTGELRSYADAVEMQKQVKTEGVKDAIVAAYKDGKRIKVSEARKINGE